MANQKANLAAVYLTNFMQTKFFVFSHRRLKFDLSFHTCRFRSCLVRIVHLAKMLCHDMNGPNILEDAPRHEFYRFKWVGSMITCVRPFSFFGKETVIHSPMLMYIMLWALGLLGPITLLVQHTYTCTALYLYRTLMPPI